MKSRWLPDVHNRAKKKPPSEPSVLKPALEHQCCTPIIIKLASIPRCKPHPWLICSLYSFLRIEKARILSWDARNGLVLMFRNPTKTLRRGGTENNSRDCRGSLANRCYSISINALLYENTTSASSMAYHNCKKTDQDIDVRLEACKGDRRGLVHPRTTIKGTGDTQSLFGAHDSHARH